MTQKEKYDIRFHNREVIIIGDHADNGILCKFVEMLETPDGLVMKVVDRENKTYELTKSNVFIVIGPNDKPLV